jgi:hypothetical protein
MIRECKVLKGIKVSKDLLGSRELQVIGNYQSLFPHISSTHCLFNRGTQGKMGPKGIRVST